jgi:hypothetical protein
MSYPGFARHRQAPQFVVRLRLQERLLAARQVGWLAGEVIQRGALASMSDE